MRCRAKLVEFVSVLTISGIALGACAKAKTPTTGPGTLKGALTFAAAGGEGEVKALKDVVTAFEAAHTGAHVTLDVVSSPSDLITKLTTAFAANTGPDLFLINYRRVGSFASQGVIEATSGIDTQGFFDRPLTAFTFNNKLLCVPSNASNVVVYYNPSLFTTAGVTVPKVGWKWDDMLAAARALRAEGVSAIGFKPALIRLAPFVWSAGGDFVDDADNPTAIDLSSPEARKAIAFMLELQKTGQSATDRAAQDPESAFAAGKIAMYLESRRAVPGFRSTDGLSFDVAPLPADKTSTSVLHSDGFCVTKISRSKPLARAFIEFVTRAQGAKILAETGRTVPIMRDVANSPAFLAPGKLPASSQVFLDQIASLKPLPRSKHWSEAEDLADEVLTQLFAGKATIDAAIIDIKDGSTREFAKA